MDESFYLLYDTAVFVENIERKHPSKTILNNYKHFKIAGAKRQRVWVKSEKTLARVRYRYAHSLRMKWSLAEVRNIHNASGEEKQLKWANYNHVICECFTLT